MPIFPFYAIQKPHVRQMAVGFMWLLLSHTAFADTTIVDGITWTYTISGDEVSIGGGSRWVR